jgi:hypothetical protein
MTLISEAAADDQFNSQMDKVQQAIIKLEALLKTDFVPVQSQVRMVEAAQDDLAALVKIMADKRK